MARAPTALCGSRPHVARSMHGRILATTSKYRCAAAVKVAIEASYAAKRFGQSAKSTIPVCLSTNRQDGFPTYSVAIAEIPFMFTAPSRCH